LQPLLPSIEPATTPSLSLLWALEGALTDRDWKEVARKDRTSLLILLDDHEKSRK